MAKLTIKDETGRERAYILTDAVTMAGRASSNTIQINDDKSSRQHFKIERRDGGFYVVDMGSTNGTRLNGSKLVLPTQLCNGDVVMVGKVALKFNTDDGTGSNMAPAVMNDPLVEPENSNKVTTMLSDKSLTNAVEDNRPPTRVGGPQYVLRVIEGASPGKIFELGKDPLTLGRHASNTIQVDDEAASNYHAEVAREPIGYVVADLGSTNGTRVKPKNRPEFEKIIKAPLKPGMQIKIGKTLLEFQNIGESVEEDDPAFGTVAIASQKLDAQIEASANTANSYGGGGGSGWGLKIGGAIAVLAGIGLSVWLIPTLMKSSGNGTTKVGTTDAAPPKAAVNLVPNSGFDQDVDDESYPKEFQVQKGSPEAVISVTAEAEHPGEKPDPQKHGLQISKGGAKSLLKPTVVETRDPIAIDPNRAYELSAWMRNDDDGIYGMRVTWVGGERSLVENPIVLKGQQGWGKEAKLATVTPPPWASHARVGVFVQGKNGKSCFDDVSFKEKTGAVAQRAPSVKNNGIVLNFEGAKGAFSVASQGKSVLEDGTLRLEAHESKAASDLSSAYKPELTKGGESNSAGYIGKIIDFAQQDFANYTIAAKPGASGVDLNVSLDLSADTTSKAVLRFYIVGNAGQGDIEIAKADGAVSRVLGTEDKDDSGVKSVLFNAGKAPQFDLVFNKDKPAAIRLKREGKRRLVEIRFENELLVAMAPEDVAQKQEMLAAAAEIKKSADAKEWGAVESKLKAFNDKYSARFAEAKDEAAKIISAKDTAWKTTQDELNRLLSTLQNAPTADLVDKARQTHQRHAEAWKNSENSPALADFLAQIDSIGGKVLNVDAEKKAEESYASAQKNFDAGNFEVTVAILQKSILENPALATTKVAEKAKELLPKAAAAFKRQKDINIIQDNLRAITKNYAAQKKYKEAIQLIESDPEFKANKADLKEIQALLEEWKKKAGL